MISKIKAAVSWLQNLRTMVAATVLVVEKEFAGKSGPEKRKIVVKRLDGCVKLPWWLDELLDIDGRLIGVMVDKICDVLNILTDGDFSNVTLAPHAVALAAEAPVKTIIKLKQAIPEKDTRQQTIDERLAEFYKQYGIAVEVAEKERAKEDDIGAALDVKTMAHDEKWDRCISIVGVAEGGANFDVIDGKPVLKPKNKNDRGGLTNHGVTQTILMSAYAKGVVGHNDIVKLTKDEARTIYRTMYCDPYGWLELPFEPCLCLLDATINHGLGGTATISQRACNDMGHKPALAVDGKWGPKTKEAVWEIAQSNPSAFAQKFLLWRKDYFDRIIASNPAQKDFRNGWYNRLRMLAKECAVKSPV